MSILQFRRQPPPEGAPIVREPSSVARKVAALLRSDPDGWTGANALSLTHASGLTVAETQRSHQFYGLIRAYDVTLNGATAQLRHPDCMTEVESAIQWRERELNDRAMAALDAALKAPGASD